MHVRATPDQQVLEQSLWQQPVQILLRRKQAQIYVHGIHRLRQRVDIRIGVVAKVLHVPHERLQSALERALRDVAGNLVRTIVRNCWQYQSMRPMRYRTMPQTGSGQCASS